jgi:hypothetical protein
MRPVSVDDEVVVPRAALSTYPLHPIPVSGKGKRLCGTEEIQKKFLSNFHPRNIMSERGFIKVIRNVLMGEAHGAGESSGTYYGCVEVVAFFVLPIQLLKIFIKNIA